MEIQLKDIAKQIRKDIVVMINKAGSGHPGGSLSAVEILVALYFTDIFKRDVTNFEKLKRDRFVLSKGHAAPAIYSILCRKGFYDEHHLYTLREMDSILQGHPHAKMTPGLDTSAGSLGQGLSIANGMAIGFKKQGLNNRVYCLLGDGECQEGQVWEAALTAAQLNLNNVCAIVDNNHIQLDGSTADIKKMEPMADKWRSFGFNVILADGHSIEAMYNAYGEAQKETTRPSVIIAETIKGKGVSFMENNSDWHGLAPNAQQLALALEEIENG